MTLRVVSPPDTEQISLEEARDHLRITPDDDSPPSHPDDAQISAFISAAREYCENHTKRSIAQKTYEVVLDAFPSGGIMLPMPPIATIVSVSYVDANGDEQTMSGSDYVLDDVQEPGWVLPAVGTSWPATSSVVNAVRVRYIAGYTLASDSPNDKPLPKMIRAAMLLMLGHLYENREAVITEGRNSALLEMGVESLLLPYRLRSSMA